MEEHVFILLNPGLCGFWNVMEIGGFCFQELRKEKRKTEGKAEKKDTSKMKT